MIHRCMHGGIIHRPDGSHVGTESTPPPRGTGRARQISARVTKARWVHPDAIAAVDAGNSCGYSERMTHAPPSSTAKRSVNVSISAPLVDEARSLGIPLSATLEAALRVRVKAERDRRWQEENREGIEQYNAMIERYGVFSDDVRLF